VYERHLSEYAELLGVPVNFEADLIRPTRGIVDGRKTYTLADIYLGTLGA
jgi:hypothetical protein